MIIDIDKEMVDLFFKIKGRLPESVQSNLKISDTNLLRKLIVIYSVDTEVKTKARIKKFLKKACATNQRHSHH